MRRLHGGDAEVYRAVRLQALATDPDCFGATHDTEAALPIETHAARLEGSAVFAAMNGDPAVGLIGFRQESGAKFVHKGLIWGFWVAPDARGQGVGAALIRVVLEHAGTLVGQVHLTVLHRNAAAIALYTRHGFVPYGREPRAIRTSAGLEDEVLMARLF